jgi:hypothetical protein
MRDLADVMFILLAAEDRQRHRNSEAGVLEDLEKAFRRHVGPEGKVEILPSRPGCGPIVVRYRLGRVEFVLEASGTSLRIGEERDALVSLMGEHAARAIQRAAEGKAAR